MSKFSFIIPVFNCKDYLPECIKSIEKIGLSEYEILLIDDGSTDGSGELCDKMAYTKDSIHCWHQVNKGVSAARNVGLDKSSGDYIIFVDADDHFDSQGIKNVINYLNSESVDLVIYGMFIDFYYKGNVYRSDELKTPLNGQKEKKEWIKYLEQLYTANALNPIWNKVFKRKFLVENQLKLREGMFLYEDLEYSLRCLAHCDKILFWPDAVYHYRQAEDEGNAGRRLKHIPHIAELVGQIEAAADELVKSEESATKSNQIDNILFSLYLVLAKEKIGVSDRKEIGLICDEFRKWFEKRDAAIYNNQKEFTAQLLNRDVRKITINRAYVFTRHRIAVRLKSLFCRKTK